ncbi:MAG: DsrE family protein [Candidatus Hydrogenedentes bacterium]|nr:DsrE family protein [Candidatus Hydrogenedentota bacterium]
MKLGLVISTTDGETVFNALRLANYSAGEGDQVKVFLLGKGVELEEIRDPRFDVRGQAASLVDSGGEILACGTCLKLRSSQASDLCPMSTMKDLYALIRESDRLLAF